MNKKGTAGYGVMVFYLLTFIVLIGGSVALGNFVFYGKGYDFRAVDSELLNYKIRECIAEEGIDVVEEKEVVEDCGLDLDVLGENNIVKVCVEKEDCLRSEGDFVFGSNFESCEFFMEKGENFVLCDREVFLVEGRRVEVITGSRIKMESVEG